MAALKWEPTALKTHFRFTAQRLGQLQAKLDSHGSITRKDIATLLQQGNVGIARAKAQKLIQEDAQGDLLETLEMELGTLLEHFVELDECVSPTTILAEAISSIIYAAPHVHCRELDIVRSTLIQRFGPDFARAAATNRENHVPSRILRAVNAPLPSATLLNAYLTNVARSYGVNWLPDPERHDIVNVLSEYLNAEVSQEIDISQLRKLCAYGLPDEPSWLRPRIWKLFFGILPPKQSEWSKEIGKQRDCYYDLVKRLLKPYQSIEATNAPAEVESLDEALLNIFKHISRIPREMFSHLEQAPEALPQNPVSNNADPAIKIAHAFALDQRLQVLRQNDIDSDADTSTPGITVSSDNESTPGISVSDFDDSDSDDSTSESTAPKTLVESRAYSFGNAHPQHCSVILRLLFIHASINPGKLSPHVPAVLVPLYTALLQEVEPDELAHVEADTFWLFEAIVSEISELDEEEGGQKWMTKFDNIVSWADPELYGDLQVKGLQPSLPHYSYRWLAPLLTYTLPIPAIFPILDAIFSRLPRERDDNYKLDFLVDVTSAMLIALRKQLLSLGQASSSSLWNDEGLAPELAAREITADGDAFLEGISMLQAYPLTSLQDAERIVQIANDLVNRREMEKNAPVQGPTLGSRIATTVWKGFTNQVGEPEDSPPSDQSDREKRGDDGNETERPSAFNLTSVLGLRPKPVPQSKELPPVPAEAPAASATSGLWGYAERLKDSDTMATLTKVGTNWRAKATLVGSWGRSSGPAGNNGQSSSISELLSRGSDNRTFGTGDRRDKSMSQADNGDQSTYNRTPSPTRQDSAAGYYSSSSTSSSLSPSPISPNTGIPRESFVDKTKNLLSIAKSPTISRSKSPRPLLLNSASPITSPTAHIRSGSEHLKAPDSSEWSEVMKMKKRYMHRESQSSISSLSPSEAFKSSARSDWDSDTGSRVIPLNRRSVSPMAPQFRVNRSQPSSRKSSVASEPFTSPQLPSHNPAMSPIQPTSAPVARSRPTVFSPTPMSPPVPAAIYQAKAEGPGVPHSDTKLTEPVAPPKSFIGEKTNAANLTEDTSDSSWQPSTVSRTARVRSKKYSQRPANLQIRDTYSKQSLPSIDQKTPSPSRANLTVEWPAEDSDVAVTPRATSFERDGAPSPGPRRSVSPRLRRPRQASTESKESKKVSSGSGRSRKVSTGDRDSKRYPEDGDDEGYDDLLSAYESEDDPRQRSS